MHSPSIPVSTATHDLELRLSQWVLLSRWSRCALWMNGLAIALLAVLMLLTGLTIPLDYLPVLGMKLIAFATLATFFQWRKADQFATTTLVILHLVAFTHIFLPVMYALAMLAAPMADSWFIAFDGWLGVHVPDIARWSKARPTVDAVLYTSYASLMYQLTLLLVVAGMFGRKGDMEEFTLQYILSMAICGLGLVIFPAEGPFSIYNLSMDAEQQEFLLQFRALRDGTQPWFDPARPVGLITFPSFHTAAAIILAWSFRQHRLLFVPMIVVNLLMVASTMTTGWHYAADVVSGSAVAIGLIVLCRYWQPWKTSDA